MAKPTLEEMVASAAACDGPAIVGELSISHSSIDPCGLRETNFEMMDLVANGLNNVARHVRPFTLVTWAWRRALQLAEREGKAVLDAAVLEGFVSRVETIFAWSNFLVDPGTPIPGASAIAPILASGEYTFSGPKWDALDKVRRTSTALSAPVNYGPGLKIMGWLSRNAANSRVLVPSPEAEAALDAFEERIADRLDHPAFNSFGPVTVTSEEARGWAIGWSLDSLTEEEKAFAARTIYGDLAPASRVKGIGFLLKAASALESMDVPAVRNAAAGETRTFVPDEGDSETAAKWRALQHRQLFRLCVEALLAWILDRLGDGPMETGTMAAKFMEEAGVDPSLTAAEGVLDAVGADEPVSEAISAITASLALPFRDGLAAAILRGLALSLANAPEKPQPYDRPDRLPLAKAAQQAKARREQPAQALVKHAIETWALAQHVYWAVGRGLQEARRGGKTILRLKAVVDEGGWTVLPGRGRLSPNPTPDRIQTALMLAAECAMS